jgi:hypothetical protein
MVSLLFFVGYGSLHFSHAKSLGETKAKVSRKL